MRPPLFGHVLFGSPQSNKSSLLECGIKCTVRHYPSWPALWTLSDVKNNNCGYKHQALQHIETGVSLVVLTEGKQSYFSDNTQMD